MAKVFPLFNYICSAEGLVWLSESIKAGRRYEGEYIYLICDIDLSKYAGGEGWKPIGGQKAPFVGTFDGCGHTITGLRVNRPSEDYQGLFGSIWGIVRNVQLRDCLVIGRDFTGSAAGCVNGGVLKDVCTFGEVRGCNMVGGIAGSCINGHIEESRFQGNIAGTNYVGGISGSAWRSKIVNSLNMSSVVKGRDCVGGITGSLFGEDLEGCRCTGRINGRSSVGGVSGRIEDGKVLRCTVACNIDGKENVGAAGGFACGGNLIEDCVFACSLFNGTKHEVNMAGQVFTFDSDSQ